MALAICITRGMREAGAAQQRRNAGSGEDVDAIGRRLGMRGHPVKEATIQTFRAILKLYKRNPKQVMDGGDGTYGILTHNHEIMALRSYSPRSIQRHRNVLKDIGLIAREVCHGSNARFEVWIKAEHLGLAQSLEAEEARREVERILAGTRELEQEIEQAAEQPSEAIGDILSCNPPFKAHVNESHASGDIRHPAQRGGFARRAGEENGAQGTAPLQWIGPGGAAAAPARPDPLATLEPGHADQVRRLSDILWLAGRKLLWPSMQINERRERQVVETIRSLYAKVAENELEMWHRRFGEMQILAAEYLERSAGGGRGFPKQGPANVTASGSGPEKARYIVPPWKWYDTKNEHGLKGTFKWWIARRDALEAGRAEYVLWTAVSKYETNLKKPPARRRDPAQLADELGRKIAAFGRPLLVEQFAIAIGKSHSHG